MTVPHEVAFEVAPAWQPLGPRDGLVPARLRVEDGRGVVWFDERATGSEPVDGTLATGLSTWTDLKPVSPPLRAWLLVYGGLAIVRYQAGEPDGPVAGP